VAPCVRPAPQRRADVRGSSAWSPVPALWPLASFLSGRSPPSRPGSTRSSTTHSVAASVQSALATAGSFHESPDHALLLRTRALSARRPPVIVGRLRRFLTAAVGQSHRLPDQSQTTRGLDGFNGGRGSTSDAAAAPSLGAAARTTSLGSASFERMR
jgi:hypothetical protein